MKINKLLISLAALSLSLSGGSVCAFTARTAAPSSQNDYVARTQAQRSATVVEPSFAVTQSSVVVPQETTPGVWDALEEYLVPGLVQNTTEQSTVVNPVVVNPTVAATTAAVVSTPAVVHHAVVNTPTSHHPVTTHPAHPVANNHANVHPAAEHSAMKGDAGVHHHVTNGGGARHHGRR